MNGDEDSQHRLGAIVARIQNPKYFYPRLNGEYVVSMDGILEQSHSNRGKFGKVLNQGNLASCTANALCSIVNSYAGVETSRLFLYYNERRYIRQVDTDSGAYLHHGIESLIHQGICPESAWPYETEKFRNKPSDQAYSEAKDVKVLHTGCVKQTLKVMQFWIWQGFAIALCFRVYSSFFSYLTATTGQVPDPEDGEHSVGGHAVIVVGYDNAAASFVCQNSWGESWGDKGYFHISYKYILDSSKTSDLWIIKEVTEDSVAC